MKTGLILINLGTPQSPEPHHVGRYLREFLSDPLVIDLPWVLRWPLVNALIVPRRSVASSKLYRKIWRDDGSPLLVHTMKLADRVQTLLGDSVVVKAAMRYGKPSLRSAIEELKQSGVDRLVAFPLYPQFSLAANQSSEDAFHDLAEKIAPEIPRAVHGAFYRDERYLDAVARVSAPYLAHPGYTLFSFHGLPEHQVKKTDTSGTHCLASAECCDAISTANAFCYRAHCYYTARELAKRLNLKDGTWEVGFQSRLGRRPWIKPYTDEIYTQLPARGIRRLTVMVPSFTADCLETLEEVAIRGKEAFLAAGGTELRLVPSLNDHPAWAAAVAQMFTSQERTRKSAAPRSWHPTQSQTSESPPPVFPM